LFDPCKVAFGKILRVETDGRISGITPEGKTVVRYLRLNEESRVKYRRGLLRYHDAVVKNPNSELAEFFKTLMSYPDNLPDLSTLQPPTNSKPAGIAKSHLARKKRNELPQTY
jgi:hypothetical protein